MTSSDTRIVPVILSGGSGTRLWPMSRADRPKQFLALAGDETMFEQTLARVGDQAMFAAPLVVANRRHVELIEQQLDGRTATLILEPAARNTAPAIALAALHAAPDAPLLVMPSDHVIADVGAFHRAVTAALPLVADGWLATFGITPNAAETGYGYIEMGGPLGDGVRRVARFVEKPDLATAEAMLADEQHVWNGGIFLFRADAYLDALATHDPEILEAAKHAMKRAEYTGSTILPDADAFNASPSDSIDYAVMEKAERVAVVPVSMGWSDLGSWDALHGLQGGGDAHDGEVIAIDTQNCLLRSDGIRIAAVGISDLIVVASGDSVLIMPKGRSQDVKAIVEALRKPL